MLIITVFTITTNMWPAVRCQQSQEHSHAHIIRTSKIVFRLLIILYGVLYCLFLPFIYISLDFFFLPFTDSKVVTLLSDDVTAWHACAWVSVQNACRKRWKCLSCCSDQQHRFQKNRSCETQLILSISDLVKCIDDHSQTDAVLLDFSKAFDKVLHSRLLIKF